VRFDPSASRESKGELSLPFIWDWTGDQKKGRGEGGALLPTVLSLRLRQTKQGGRGGARRDLGSG